MLKIFLFAGRGTPKKCKHRAEDTGVGEWFMVYFNVWRDKWEPGKSQYWVSKKWQTQAEVQERQGLKSRADTKQLYKQANKHWETTRLETKTVCSGHCGLPACIWRFHCGSLDCMRCSWWGSTQTLTHLCPLQQLHKHTFTFRVLKGTWMKSFQNRDTTCFSAHWASRGSTLPCFM